MIPYLSQGPGAPLPTNGGRSGRGTAGRPTRFGKFAIRPAPERSEGFVQLNTTPELLQQAQRRYIDKQELPPSLLPRRLSKTAPLPQSLLANRNKNISRGWRKPQDGR